MPVRIGPELTYTRAPLILVHALRSSGPPLILRHVGNDVEARADEISDGLRSRSPGIVCSWRSLFAQATRSRPVDVPRRKDGVVEGEVRPSTFPNAIPIPLPECSWKSVEGLARFGEAGRHESTSPIYGYQVAVFFARDHQQDCSIGFAIVRLLHCYA